jgi:hypothetical protein
LLLNGSLLLLNRSLSEELSAGLFWYLIGLFCFAPNRSLCGEESVGLFCS